MATNASTWFYTEPEHRAYLIEERINHTLWAHRINGAQLKCTQAEPPFQMTGAWNGIPLTLEWKPKDYFVFTARANHTTMEPLIQGFKEILGFVPTISYMSSDGVLTAEWRSLLAEQRAKEIQGNPNYSEIKRYK